jgi:hypothetical protein
LTIKLIIKRLWFINLKKIQPEAAALYVRFQEKPYDILNQSYEIEIINYEKTWLHICNYLNGIYKGVNV